MSQSDPGTGPQQVLQQIRHLHEGGLSTREIARIRHWSQSKVARQLKAATAADTLARALLIGKVTLCTVWTLCAMVLTAAVCSHFW